MISVGTRKVDIIFNTTLICPWDCAVCCVDAVHVRKLNGFIEIKSERLSRTEHLPISTDFSSIYDQAAAHRQKQGRELTLDQKKTMIDNLEGFDVKIDISGGDALAVSENFLLLQYAAERLGRDHVTLTVTGAGSGRFPAERIAPFISEYNFTFDAERLEDVANRPDGYALGNLKKARAFVVQGIPTRAELPLTKSIMSVDHLRRIHRTLNEAGIGKLLLMRLFPVGRGMLLPDEIPTALQYQAAIETLQALEREFKTPVLKIQCALKHLVGLRSSAGGNPCDLGHESFGLMADGTLLASPWAVNERGAPLSEGWTLGNLYKSSLAEILSSERCHSILDLADNNFGHCKIFSFLNSQRTSFIGRISDQADPLYVQ